MALILPTLQQRLLAWAQTSWPSPVASAQQLSSVYCSYASAAQAGGIPGIVLPSSQQLLTAQLITAGSSMAAPAWAGLVADGLVSFWSTVTFAGMVSPPVGAAGIPAFTALAASMFAVGLADGPFTATIPLLASAFDAFTRLVVVTFPLPAGPQTLL